MHYYAESMFEEKQVGYSALFILLVGWHTHAVSLPPGDIILAQLAWPLNDVIFCLHREQLTYLYKHSAECHYAECQGTF